MGYVGIIDDDALVREALKDCLESAGYSVETFGSAEEFLALTRRASCLVVDIQLPGISGLELQSRLSTLGGQVDIVFVTARGTDVNREQALRNGAAAFLSKPVRCEKLLTAVRLAIQAVSWCLINIHIAWWALA